MEETASLEHRISHYEALEGGSSRLSAGDWLALALTGICFPALCLVLGWLVGW
jgi:hypothetical protein